MKLDKIICPCYKITKGDILKAIEDGAKTFKDVKKETKATKACGHCKKRVKRLTKKIINKRQKLK